MTLNSKNIETNKHIELSIQISLNGLSFCILENDTQTISFLKRITLSKKQNPFELLEQLKGIFISEKALHADFNKVTLIHVNELATLVPETLFNENCLSDYLKFNAKILKSDFIAFDSIKSNNSVNVYVPYVNINNYIYEKFGAFNYKHFSTVLIENLLLEEKNNTNAKMFVHVETTHFEIIVVQQGQLVLYNSFEFKTKEDFIYYILFTAEQLNLTPDTLQLVLLGLINANDTLYNIAYKYIRHVHIYNKTHKYKYSTPTNTNHSNYALTHSF